MRITVIGLGLIGSSMALDLKTRGWAAYVIGVDNNAERCKQALEKKIADEIVPSVEAHNFASLQSDMVILSVPVTTTAKMLPHILDHIGENTVVVDVGSTKQQICKLVKTHPRRKQFVGTHPIVGAESPELAASVKNLFDNKSCVLCVHDSALWAVERVSELYETLNMKLLFMEADEHDRCMAYGSHLFHIASCALAETILEMKKNVSPVFDMAGPGLLSAVRFTQSTPDRWAPAFEQNSKYVSKALGTFIRHLTKFKKDIDKKNMKGIYSTMVKANAIGKILK